MSSPEQGRVFLKWQLVLPISFEVLISFTWKYLVPFRLILEGVRLANTWSYLEGMSSFQLGGRAPSTACLLPFTLAFWREIINYWVSFWQLVYPRSPWPLAGKFESPYKFSRLGRCGDQSILEVRVVVYFHRRRTRRLLSATWSAHETSRIGNDHRPRRRVRCHSWT